MGNGLDRIGDPAARTSIPFTFAIPASHSARSNQTHPAENRLQRGKYWARRTDVKSVFKIFTAVIALVTELKYFTHSAASGLLSVFCVSF